MSDRTSTADIFKVKTHFYEFFDVEGNLEMTFASECTDPLRASQDFLTQLKTFGPKGSPNRDLTKFLSDQPMAWFVLDHQGELSGVIIKQGEIVVRSLGASTLESFKALEQWRIDRRRFGSLAVAMLLGMIVQFVVAKFVPNADLPSQLIPLWLVLYGGFFLYNLLRLFGTFRIYQRFDKMYREHLDQLYQGI